MKRIRKIASLIFCLVIVLVMAVPVSADTEISKVEITCSEPVSGMKGSDIKFSVKTKGVSIVKNGEIWGYSSTPVFIYHATGEVVGQSDKFSTADANGVEVRFVIKASDGYHFSDDCEVYLNGEYAYLPENTGTRIEADVSVGLPVHDAAKVINNVAITVPELCADMTVGEVLSGLTLADTKKASVTKTWMTVSSTEDFKKETTLGESDVLQAGKYYRVYATLTPSGKCYYTSAVSSRATINGVTAKIKKTGSKTQSPFNVYAALPVGESKKTPIEKIDLKVANAPSVGSVPKNDYVLEVQPAGAVTVPEGGAGWYVHDPQQGYIPFDGAKFENGGTYAFIVHFNEADGFKIDSSTKILAEGIDAPLNVDESSWYTGFYYDQLNAQEIKSIVISDVIAPVTGKAPQTSCTVTTDPAGAADVILTWYEKSGETFVPFAGESFEPEKEYTAVAEIAVKEGFALVDETAVTVNGQTAEVEKDDAGIRAQISFPKTAKLGFFKRIILWFKNLFK